MDVVGGLAVGLGRIRDRLSVCRKWKKRFFPRFLRGRDVDENGSVFFPFFSPDRFFSVFFPFSSKTVFFSVFFGAGTVFFPKTTNFSTKTVPEPVSLPVSSLLDSVDQVLRIR